MFEYYVTFLEGNLGKPSRFWFPHGANSANSDRESPENENLLENF